MPRGDRFSGIFWDDLNHAPGVRSVRANRRFVYGCEIKQIRSQICVCGHSPPLSGKQRARKSPYFSARLPHGHLLQRSDWPFDTSVTVSPASWPLALADGGASCPAVDAIRRRTRFMPALGRKAPRRIHEAGLLLGCRFSLEFFLFEVCLKNVFSNPVGPLTGSPVFWAEAVRLALTALCLFYSHWEVCECGFQRVSGAMIKAAYAVGYTPIRQENTQETASPRFSSQHSFIHDSERNLKVSDLITFTLIQLVNSQCNIPNVSYFGGAWLTPARFV